MKLRKQLFLISLFLLILPLAGFLYVREMEAIIKLSQQQAILSTAQAITDRVHNDLGLQEFIKTTNNTNTNLFAGEQTYLGGKNIYFHDIQSNLNLDGYEDDWQALNVDYHNFINVETQQKIGVKSVKSQNFYYIFATVNTTQFSYHNPQFSFPASGDYFRLILGSEETNISYVLRTSAPGQLQVVYERDGKIFQEFRIKGFLREYQSDIQVELQIPQQLMGDNFGIAFVPKTGTPLGNFMPISDASNPKKLEIPKIQTQIVSMNAFLNGFTHENTRVLLTNQQGWILGDINRLDISDESLNQQTPPFFWLLRLALNTRSYPAYYSRYTQGFIDTPETQAAILNGNMLGNWYRYDASNQLIRMAVPLADETQQIFGAVVLEQTTASWWFLTANAVSSLFIYTSLATLISGFALLVYASWLSYRIRKLKRYVDQSIDSEGSVHTLIPVSKAKDEIGELYRSYAEIIGRVGEYTHYLKTLSSKLSHELRTPIAVVKTSLDNLELTALDNDQRKYLERSQQGVARLSNILSSMASAKRLEETITRTELESFSITDLLKDVSNAYQSLAETKSLRFSSNIDHVLLDSAVFVNGAPDLIVQALDKLIDNALDFCVAEGEVTLSAIYLHQRIKIVIANDGPLLPESMKEQLFDSLVSLRSNKQTQTAKNNEETQVHLGLGLFIVKLVVDFHNGRVYATNKSNNRGVEFAIELPCKGR
ncbi:proteobacterial dedicated sortase system histidine kinase [Sessilibacter sp. MAH1]